METSETELVGLGPDLASQQLSYPSGSLNFVRSFQPVKPKGASSHGQLRLSILVIGAGLGGLAAAIALVRKGHTATILEQAQQLAEVGAGIQIPPNSSRLLVDWGLEPFLREHIVEPECITLRRWQDGSAIGYTKLKPDFSVKYQAPYWLVHRAHFHSAMYELALSEGVKVKVAHKVIEYDENVPSVIVESGQIFSADFIVAADGLKSVARKHILGENDRPPRPSGFSAYRATVPASKMQTDPELRPLLDRPGQSLWVGDNRHVMAYTIAGGGSFNLVMNRVDHSDPSEWKAETALQDLRDMYKGWDPKLIKIIDLIEKTVKWPLLTGNILDTWVSKSAKLAILGDSAHPMVPYMSQGAAMAVEDGAALAEALTYATSSSDLARVLKVFETVRSKRCSQMQQASLVNGVLIHFPDGPLQQARDAAMRAEVEGRPFTESPNQWSDPATANWAYGYNAVDEIARAFQEQHTRPSHEANLAPAAETRQEGSIAKAVL